VLPRNLSQLRRFQQASTERRSTAERRISRLSALLARAGAEPGDLLPARTCEALIASYPELTTDERKAFIEVLSQDFGADGDEVARAVNQWQTSEDADVMERLSGQRQLRAALEPKYERLFAQIKRHQGGLKFLVDLRRDVLEVASQSPLLKNLEVDLGAVLAATFRVGELELIRVTWRSEAALLEKLMGYERVIAFESWMAIKQRLGRCRRLYAYQHPLMPGEPLVFVQVALTDSIADNIQAILEQDTSTSLSDAPQAAMFYSISSTQAGLRGIDLGNFLIKRVVSELQRDHPTLQHFSTLSPIPGFRHWLRGQPGAEDKLRADPPWAQELLNTEEERAIVGAAPWATKGSLDQILNSDWVSSPCLQEALRPVLMRLGTSYLYAAKKMGKKQVLDPVANFHIRNGATLYRLNWLADVSDKGFKDSACLMVNYLYELERIECNSRRYLTDGEVVIGEPFKEEYSLPG